MTKSVTRTMPKLSKAQIELIISGDMKQASIQTKMALWRSGILEGPNLTEYGEWVKDQVQSGGLS